MLRRFPRRRTILLYLSVMGPGIVAACAGNDAGGIATYALAGAKYGYNLLWVLFVITFLLALVQEMCARMGAVTQKGLGELIREEFGVRWTMFALAIMFVANTATTIAEFAGIAAAGELFDMSKYYVVPLCALLMWLVITQGSFRNVERVFIVLSLISVCYVVAAFLAKPDWREATLGLVRPRRIALEPNYLLLTIAVIGTTITPWMQFFLQSTVVDKGIKVAHYRYQRADVVTGAFTTDFIAFFIIVATAATLFKEGVPVNADTFTAQDAALALKPIAGDYCEMLFAFGLLNASLLTSAVLPLATAYTYCEAFGWEMGLSKRWRDAPTFYSLYTLTLLIGAGAVLLPRLPLMKVMLISQDVNGILLPVVLIFILLLVNNRRIMGRYTNPPLYNFLAWATVVTLIGLTVVLVGSSLVQGFG